MGFRLGQVGIALVAGGLLLAAGPLSAASAEPQENSHDSQYERLASKLKAGTEHAFAAASRAVEKSKSALAAAETELAPRLETFGTMLNEQKARLAIVGKDATARLDAWRQAAKETWPDRRSWAETWSESWAEIHRSASEALDWFRDWIEKQSVSDEPTPV